MIPRFRAFALRVFASVFRRGAEAGLDEELEAHLDMAIEWYVREGFTLEEARRKALLDLGGVDQTRERYAIREVYRCWKARFRIFVTVSGCWPGIAVPLPWRCCPWHCESGQTRRSSACFTPCCFVRSRYQIGRAHV